jgi:hypothetical protein
MSASRLLLSILTAAGLGLAGTAMAATDKTAYDAAVKAADVQYKSDKAACDSLSGNAKDICVKEAKGKEKVAKAEADAAYRATPRARQNARVAAADAVYDVAKEKCDDLAGNPKDVCVKEAKAAHVRATADAKVDRVAADARTTTVDKTAEARREASNDKRDADYKVAVEKCDALAGTAKDSCVRDAKMRFGKS